MKEGANADDVRAFWDEQAATHRDNDLATAPDHYYRELEISRIIPHLSDHGRILDVGCGNGFSTLQFAEANPSAWVVGLDYSAPMITEAIAASKKRPDIRNLAFVVGDVLDLRAIHDGRMSRYDTIITERCLINLKDFETQKKALLEMKDALQPGGKLVLVENTIEGLHNLNMLRGRVGLKRIEMRWHNQYLPQQEFLKFARKHFTVQCQDNIGNLYYILSRVVYAKMAEMEGLQPNYNHPINKIAAQLPSLPAYSWSPNYLFVLRKD